MENKKNPKLDLRKKSRLFFNIGLVISLLSVLFAFEYKSQGEGNPLPFDYVTEFPNEVIIPNTNFNSSPPTPKPKKIIVVVDEEAIIEVLLPGIDTESTEELAIPDEESEDIAPEKAEEIFIVVEELPTYPGGYQALYKYIGKNINTLLRQERWE